ncbi:MAG: putative thiol-disulfide oxidoreductase [Myxococcales bacterium]|nr:putative thiol-disulfide oxidoreductase [Myxococcales bacterium]
MPSVLPTGKRVEVFYDGDCPLCMREIRMLMRKGLLHHIQFTNLAAPGFAAEEHGTTYAALMERIRGRLPDGTWIEGVDVFRELYAAVGFRRLVAISRVPGLSHLLALGYRVFAKNRLRWTGRCLPDQACAVP